MTESRVDRISRLMALKVSCGVILDEVAGLLEMPESIDDGNDVLHLEFMKFEALAGLFRDAGELPEPVAAERQQAEESTRHLVDLIKSHGVVS